MPAPAIRVDNLSKLYRLGKEERAGTLVGAIGGALASPWRNFRRLRSLTRFDDDAGEDVLWALRDVSFEVAPGEVVGIIGRNGAGKSTLLKILSRITLPSRGRVEIHGRLSSLLEVGTGFHPELSGRDNIYLNGAILGLTRHEIRARFDDIVDFAEIGRFLDTPVKRYSSGMYVRLAFAVAAHLEPEILVVDEVLAVGDAAFQQKCLGKMRDVSRTEGRTILFVSHNLGAVSSLTRSCLWLDDGRLAARGPTPEIVRKYLGKRFQTGCEWRSTSATSHPLQITTARLLDAAGGPATEAEAAEGFQFEIEYVVREPARLTLVEAHVFTPDGVHVLTLGDHDADPSALAAREPGFYRKRVRVPGGWLNCGTYALHLNSGTSHATYDAADAFSFAIVEHASATPRAERRGLLVPLLPWSLIEARPPASTVQS